MDLSRSLLKDFAEIANGSPDEGKETNQYARGTITSNGDTKYVQLDGSSMLTPISEVVDVQDGDRVLVSIENHKATILGNFTFPPSARKEQEALDKAEDAQTAAEGAQDTADGAQTVADAASEKAQSAITKAEQAVSSAEAASTASSEAKSTAQEAMTAANTASTNAQTAKDDAALAKSEASTARQEAAAAQAAVANAEAEFTAINKEITAVKGDINTALGDIADQAAEIEATKQTLEVNYAKKTEVSSVEAALKTEISTKVGELQTTVAQTYAAKTEVVEMQGQLQSQITQNAEGLSSTVTKVEKLESDTTEAKKQVDIALDKAEAAQTAASAAQTAATTAQTAADEAKANAATASSKADAAQTAADTAQAAADAADKAVQSAKTDLNEAKQNLANVTSRVDATETEIAEAQAAVTAAQTAVDDALADAAEANLAATNAKKAADQAALDAAAAQSDADAAQLKATNAQATADKAQEDADQALKDVAELTSRVTSAETKITQNTEAIELAASKTEEIGTKLDNLEIGGRNLAEKTNNGLTGWAWSMYEGEYTLESIEDNGVNCVKMTRDDSIQSGWSVILYQYICPHKYEPSTEYTISMDVLMTGGTPKKWQVKLDITSGNNPISDYGKASITENDKWVKMVFKLTTLDTFPENIGNQRLYIISMDSGPGLSYTIKNLKIEKGNKPTDWTPAPEDIENELVNNYYNKTQTDAKIKVESDRITQTVTKIEEVEETVAGIEIGGRNLLFNTNFSTSLDSEQYSTRNNAYELSIQSDGYNGSNCLKATANDIGSIDHDIIMTTVFDNELNTEYVFSGYVKADVETTLTVRFGYGQNKPTVDVGTEWSYFSVIVKSGVNDGEEWGQLLPYVNSLTSVYFSYLKLEKGNKATDWTPAPEDMATSEEVDNAQATADSAAATADSTESRVTVAESAITQLSDSISSLVTDENGNSMMTQTSDGWTFNMGAITSTINNATSQLGNLAGTVSGLDQAIDNANSLLNDLTQKTAYIVMTTDDTGAPCIELGKSDNDFKVRITNTSIDFMDGTSKIAYISNQALYIETAVVKNELQIGDGTGFVWKRRENGNMGLRYV